MENIMLKILLVFAFSFSIISCSSIKSTESPSDSDGLSYYMPKKDFVVTVNVKSSKITKVTLGTTPAYPDLSKQYVLRHGSNYLGKNTLDVSVNEKGLLTSSKSTTVSNVTDAFKNLATTYGQLRTFSLVGTPPATGCTTDGDHIFTYNGVGAYNACGISIVIGKPYLSPATKKHEKPEEKSYSGIFYRQNEPYNISATGNGLNVSSIVFSPSDAKTLFLPVSKTFFANNEAEFTFKDGIPTKYKQDTDGEIIAALKLPADIIGEYFGAVGSIFDSFKSKDDSESAAMSSALSLELAKKKYAACIEAIEKNDNDLIKELECK